LFVPSQAFRDGKHSSHESFKTNGSGSKEKQIIEIACFSRSGKTASGDVNHMMSFSLDNQQK
jgi:hypothetical protein